MKPKYQPGDKVTDIEGDDGVITQVIAEPHYVVRYRERNGSMVEVVTRESWLGALTLRPGDTVEHDGKHYEYIGHDSFGQAVIVGGGFAWMVKPERLTVVERKKEGDRGMDDD